MLLDYWRRQNKRTITFLVYETQKKTGEVAQWLRALAAVAESLGSGLTTHMMVHNHTLTLD